MSTNIPTCLANTPVKELGGMLFEKKWDSTHDIYVVDDQKCLLGQINVATTGDVDLNTSAGQLMHSPKVTLRPHRDQEQAVFHAIKDDVVAIPVIDKDETFLGVVTSHAIVDIMHEEHVEDVLLSAGISHRGASLLQRLTEGVPHIVISRAPWLIAGTIAGLALGLLTSWFEESLQGAIAIVYFIPVVAYVAGSVGAQSSAVAVRSLALMKIKYVPYLVREGAAGAVLGLVVGIMGVVGGAVIGHSLTIGIAVGISLFLVSIISTTLAALIPIILKVCNKDPAPGSGPMATALLDIIGIGLYFLIVTAIV